MKERPTIFCVSSVDTFSKNSCKPQEPCNPDNTDPPDAPDNCSPDCGPFGNCRPDCGPYD